MARLDPRPAIASSTVDGLVGDEPVGDEPHTEGDLGGQGDREDDALLAAFRRGDRGTGLLLYRRLVPVVDATLFRVLGRRDADHADLVQAAFEQIVITLSKDRFEFKCSLSSWASVIACHVGLTALRSLRRRRGVIVSQVDPEGLPVDGPAASNPEQTVAAQRELMALRSHLAEMDEDRTTTLLLHAMGHSLKEIAQLTNVSVAAAQSRLSRGRRELLARLRPDSVGSMDETHARATRGR